MTTYDQLMREFIKSYASPMYKLIDLLEVISNTKESVLTIYLQT